MRWVFPHLPESVPFGACWVLLVYEKFFHIRHTGRVSNWDWKHQGKSHKPVNTGNIFEAYYWKTHTCADLNILILQTQSHENLKIWIQMVFSEHTPLYSQAPKYWRKIISVYMDSLKGLHRNLPHWSVMASISSHISVIMSHPPTISWSKNPQLTGAMRQIGRAALNLNMNSGSHEKILSIIVGDKGDEGCSGGQIVIGGREGAG